MQELKPCPCCGSSNGLYVLLEDEHGRWSVFCDMCKTSFHNENHCDTRDDAISAWNRRAERTCRNLLSGQYDGETFKCSERVHVCEVAITDEPEPFSCFTDWYCELQAYCPHCGARVIEEES